MLSSRMSGADELRGATGSVLRVTGSFPGGHQRRTGCQFLVAGDKLLPGRTNYYNDCCVLTHVASPLDVELSPRA